MSEIFGMHLPAIPNHLRYSNFEDAKFSRTLNFDFVKLSYFTRGILLILPESADTFVCAKRWTLLIRKRFINGSKTHGLLRSMELG
jgi:hypothetical protein